MEPCMNSNGTYNCDEAPPVFNVTQPSWCIKPTDGPSTTITDIITTLSSNATTSLFTEPTTSSRVTTEKPELTEPSLITTEPPPEELGIEEIIGIVAGVLAIFVIIIVLVFYWNKHNNKSDEDPSTLQPQTSTIGLIGTDEPDGGGSKTIPKDNVTISYKNDVNVEIEKGGQSKDGCDVEFKKAPIVKTTDL